MWLHTTEKIRLKMLYQEHIREFRSSLNELHKGALLRLDGLKVSVLVQE